MAFNDSRNREISELGTAKGFKDETAEQRRRRDQRVRSERIKERAQDLLENDPDVNDWNSARRAAREQIEAEEEYEAGVRKGTVDRKTGNPTRRARSRPRRAAAGARPSTARRPHRSSRSSRRAARVARSTGRAIVAPFGSVGAAGWTLVTGAAGVLLLGALLQDAGTVQAFTNAVLGALGRITDPFMPLLPSHQEATPPPATTRTVTSSGHKARPRRPIQQGRAQQR